MKMEEKIIQETKKMERKIPTKSDLENQNLEYEKALLSFEIERLIGFRANISGEYKKQDYVAYNEILAAQERTKEIEEKLEEIKQLQEAKIEIMQNKENGTHN